ncbi:MAG: AAA family ATPase [Polyangiaceae bacterium]|nr:AAA family ATPase [Polyangiaceae bacterium]
MGKKSKNHGNAPRVQPGANAAAPAPSALITRFLAAAQQAPLASQAVPDWSETEILGLLEQLVPESRGKLQGFLERFASLGSELKDACGRQADAQRSAEAAKSKHDEALAALETDRASLARERADLEKRSAELANETAVLASRTGAVVAQERDLISREAAVRAGLFDEQQKALATLRAQVEALESRRQQLPFAIEEERQALLAAARQVAEGVLAQAKDRLMEVEQRQIAIGEQELGLGRRDERLRLNEALLKARRESLSNEIRDQFEHDLQEKAARIGKLEKQRDDLHDRIDRLQAELDEFSDLRDRLGGSPQTLLDELESLRLTKRALDRQVQELLASRSEDDASLLRGQRDRLQERLQEAENELFGLRHRASEWQRSVTERQDWQLERVAMLKRRELLAEAVQRLQADVDGLVNRQKESTAFPELTRMDVELTAPAVTERAPLLKDLIPELQARIAFAESGKELHFRREDLQLFLGGLAMSQLHILQGISGTGKTSLATAFAKAVGGVCTTIPVQAGWRDRADLLGHYNAFEKRYYERNTLQAIYRAQTEADKDRIHIVLLDEMNLSRPEQYFAEFLSALELAEGDRWINLMESRPAHGAPSKLRNGRDIWLPPNLWFIGTANHDETTSAFADKTHDRSFVLDLPKHEPSEGKLKRPTGDVKWRYSSLQEQFEIARKHYQEQIVDLMAFVNASRLTKVLQDDFELGWGNRLERQMGRFVPVVLEVGGTEGLAVDHLLCSRMFRDGKVIGRHDVRADDLKKVESALFEMWKDCELDGEPTRCLRQLRKDIQRLERGG